MSEPPETDPCEDLGTPCDFCKQMKKVTYFVNPEGGYGHCELWACAECLLAAEDNSLLTDRRERYAEMIAEDAAQ